MPEQRHFGIARKILRRAIDRENNIRHVYPAANVTYYTEAKILQMGM
jgi:hypothetical protein